MGQGQEDQPLDELEKLLIEVLVEIDKGTPIEDVLLSYPEQAPGLRRRLAHLGHLNLDGSLVREMPTRVGVWCLEALLGRGGMGEVWRAVRQGDGCVAALKIVRSGTLGPKHTARFEREATALAALDHPGIVKLLDVGEADGYRFIAMELLEGKSLADLLRDGPSPGVPSIVHWGHDLARALAAAHARGVVHRDVKPSNIQITPEGRAVLIDFGLTRGVGPSSLSITGRFVGSPHYAAPEQIRGSTDAVGPGADIYSLGVTLYEAVSGTVPFEGASTEQLFHNILTQPPIALRSRKLELPIDLETVIHCALEKNPARRYSTASALAADLEAVMGLRPIRAKRPSFVQRGRRWARRHRAMASGLAVSLAATLVFVTAVLIDRRNDNFRRVGEAAANLGQAEDLFEQYLNEEQNLPRKLMEYDWKRPEQEASPYSHAATLELNRLQREIEETKTLRERAFTSAMEKLRLAEDLDPNLDPAVNRLRARIYLERWRHARTEGDRTMGTFYAQRVREYDTGGEFAASVDPTRKISVVTIPEGARVDAFVYRRQDEFVEDGEPRLVPVPFGGFPDGPLPGTSALKVRTAQVPLMAEDVLLAVAGQPVLDSVFVRWPEGGVDRVLSIGDNPVRNVGEAEDALRREDGVNSIVVLRDGDRVELERSGPFEILSPLELALEGGHLAQVWRDGHSIGIELPKGLVLRPTAAPFLHSPESFVGVTPVLEVPVHGDELMLLIRKEGYEPQRVPLIQGDSRIEIRLDLLGAFPESFVRIRSSSRQMIVMDREVTQGEYEEFLSVNPGHPVPGGWTRHSSGSVQPPAGSLSGFPLHSVSYRDALAYADWRTESARADGHGWSFGLPDAEEWLALIQVYGVRRRFVWGADFRTHYAKSCFSRDRPRLEPILRFPVDETMHGLHDTAGSVAELCEGWFWLERRQRSVFGGSWVNAQPKRFQMNDIWGAGENNVFEYVGFRLELKEN